MATADLELVTETDARNPVVGDLRIVGRALSVIRGAAAVAQEANVRVRWWRGEWFLDRSQGVRYFEKLFRSGASAAGVRAVLLDDALSLVPDLAPHPTVTVEIDRATRRCTVDVEGALAGGEAVKLSDVQLAGGA